jgi:hypothetical protein
MEESGAGIPGVVGARRRQRVLETWAAGAWDKAAAVGTGEVNGEKNSKQVFQ